MPLNFLKIHLFKNNNKMEKEPKRSLKRKRGNNSTKKHSKPSKKQLPRETQKNMEKLWLKTPKKKAAPKP